MRYVPPAVLAALLALPTATPQSPEPSSKSRTEQIAIGTVISKTPQPASVYRRSPDSSGRRPPTEIPIAESVLFEIKIPSLGTVRYSANIIAAARFNIGDRVRVSYVKRAIVPFHTRIYVREINPAEE